MDQGCKALCSGGGAWSCCCLSLGKAACRWWGKQGLGVLGGFLQSVHLWHCCQLQKFSENLISLNLLTY